MLGRLLGRGLVWLLLLRLLLLRCLLLLLMLLLLLGRLGLLLLLLLLLLLWPSRIADGLRSHQLLVRFPGVGRELLLACRHSTQVFNGLASWIRRVRSPKQQDTCSGAFTACGKPS